MHWCVAAGQARRTAGGDGSGDDGHADGEAEEGVAGLGLGGGRLQHHRGQEERPHRLHEQGTPFSLRTWAAHMGSKHTPHEPGITAKVSSLMNQ